MNKRWPLLFLLLLVGAVAWLAARGCAAKPKFNLLLITLDTTRADRLGCYGYAGAHTPHLDALSAAGALFERAYTCAPLTLPAHASLLTGLYPPEHGLRINGRGRLPGGVPTLAETLRARGYQTAAFIASVTLDSRYGLDRGFDVYDDEAAGLRPEHEGLELYAAADAQQLQRYRPGDEMADAALGWLAGAAAAGRPFFAWVHFYDPHQPYADHTNEFARPVATNGYDTEVAFMDAQVGRLVDFLRRRGLERRTLVVAVGDHGEGLGEHGEHTHGFLLYDSTLRIPLLLAWPGRIPAGLRVPAAVPLTDLAPTILELLLPGPGRARAAESARRRSLAGAFRGAPLSDRVCYAETDQPYTGYGWSPLRGCVDAEWKYIRSTRPELYDLRSDPGETNDLAGAQPGRARELAAALAGLEQGLRPVRAEAVALPAAERRQLESLGYAVGGGAAPAAGARPLRDIKDMLPLTYEGGGLIAAFRRRDFGTATLATAQRLVEASPETAIFQNNLGTVHLQRGDWAAARRNFAAATEGDPGFADAFNNLGIVCSRQGDFAAAVPAFERALELGAEQGEVAGNFALACNEYGLALGQQGDYARAAAMLERAVALKPDFAEAHHNLGVAYMGQQRVPDAIRAFEAALRIRPDYPLARRNLDIARGRPASP